MASRVAPLYDPEVCMASERIFSEGMVLPDGRKVRVLAYEDRSVRIRIDGTPYVIEECFLSGGSQDHAIIKLAPRK